MTAFGDRRLIVWNPGSDEWFILDPRAGVVVDQFAGVGSAVSPDGRFIAFSKLIGRANPDDGALYLIYDVSLSPSENRMGPLFYSPLGRLTGIAGFPIYPGENRVKRSYEVATSGSSGFHEKRSELTWSDSRTLVFLDCADNVAKAVVAKFGEGPHEVNVADREADLMSVLDPARVDSGTSPCELHSISITWIGCVTDHGRTVVRMTFPSEDLKYRQWSLDVPF